MAKGRGQQTRDLQGIHRQSDIFIETDKAIAASAWYKDNRGYKAEIVTYTIAVIAGPYHALN